MSCVKGWKSCVKDSHSCVCMCGCVEDVGKRVKCCYEMKINNFFFLKGFPTYIVTQGQQSGFHMSKSAT